MADLSINRRAHFDYTILETYEAGLALAGYEVKAIKAGRMSLIGAYVVIKDNEAWLLNATISPYQPKNTPISYDPERSRRLLLHRKEIRELIGKTSKSGLTIIPLKVYTSHNRVKILIGLSRHKKAKDKRETIKKREARKEISRALKRNT